MENFVFEIPSRILFGRDSIKKLGNECSALGKRALLVTEDILSEWNIPEKIRIILEEAGCDCIIHSDLETHSTSVQIEKGRDLAKKGKVQIIIGLGGVRALSIAKCIAKTAAADSSVDDYLDGLVFGPDSLPYIEIPTTCRTPFMLTGEAPVIDARNRQVCVLQTGVFPAAAVIDPVLSETLSPKYTAMTMLDTVLCCIEGLVSKKSTFFSDSLILRALRSTLCCINSSVSDPKNISYREQASQAGLLTAIALSMSKIGIGTALSHGISGKFMVPQSWVASVLLPRILSLHVNTHPEKISRVYDILDPSSRNYGEPPETGESVEKAEIAVDSIRHIIASLKLPMRLSNFDLKTEQLFSVAEKVKQFPGVESMPTPITSEGIYTLIKQSF